MHVLNASTHINKMNRNSPRYWKEKCSQTHRTIRTHTTSNGPCSNMLYCLSLFFSLIRLYPHVMAARRTKEFVFPHAAILFPQPQLIYLLCIKNYNWITGKLTAIFNEWMQAILMKTFFSSTTKSQTTSKQTKKFPHSIRNK